MQDTDGEVDFGEGKKNIFALTGNRDSDPEQSGSADGGEEASEKEEAYISADFRTALRTAESCIARSSGQHPQSRSLQCWYSTNYNVEVHAYVKNNKYCVVNNTYDSAGYDGLSWRRKQL